MKHLLVTNDFPPKVGGIQSYLWELWRRLPPDSFAVLTSPHGDADEWDRRQPFLVRRVREPVLLPHPIMVNRVQAIANMVIWGDNPSGEVFAIPADNLPSGGQAAIRRVLFNDGGQPRTLLQLIQKATPGATQPDLRLGLGPDGAVLLLNKADGIVRRIGR